MENPHLVNGHGMLHCLDIHVVDVKNVFLQAEMKEEEIIYVTQPEGYIDSDTTNLWTSKSITGCSFFYAHTPILWMSCLKKVVSLSSCKAEYYTLSKACTYSTSTSSLDSSTSSQLSS